MVLYAVWILPEIVAFRNTALVIGAIAGLYPIYQYRGVLWTIRSIPVWLVVALFAWALFHLLFLAHDYDAQLLEFKRIWKYAALGGILSFGLGISLANTSRATTRNGGQGAPYWWIIYLGLCLPVTIYLLKYTLTAYGDGLGIQVPAYLRIYFASQPYYIPKSDYVAFCLPALAIAFGQIHTRLILQNNLKVQQYPILFFYMTVIVATLFLFDVQNIKNGMAYAAVCMGLFTGLFLIKALLGNYLRKLVFVLAGVICLGAALYPHLQRNDSWQTLIADTKVAFQLDKYPAWKYAGGQGYPLNEYGKTVSITNYERAAWFKAGLQLAANEPFGYGLVEDSFKKMAKAQWPEVSDNLSHSHSGWLDVFLALGFPGFICLFGAMIIVMGQSMSILQPWQSLVAWGIFANLALWVTTEVSATVTFAALIFWICLSAGLTLYWSPKAQF